MSNERNERFDLASIGYYMFIFSWVMDLPVRIWTVIIAYKMSGIWTAVISAPLPLISDIYWLIRVGTNTGFTSAYCITVIALLSLIILSGLLFCIGIMLEVKE